MTYESLVDRAEVEGLNDLGLAELLALAVSRHRSDVDGFLPETVKLVRELRGFDLRDSENREMWFESFGLEGFERVRLQAAIRLGATLSKSSGGNLELYNQPEKVYEGMKDLSHEEQEHFYVLCLDTKSKLKRKILLHKGTLDTSIVGIREIFRFAVRESASSIICVHNHPSGDPTPSPQDIAITNKIGSVGRELGIYLVDHIIIGKATYLSMRKEGYYKQYE